MLSALQSAPASMSTIATISYEYDALNRLTEANYDNGNYYYYTYDEVGNRKTETTPGGVTAYDYDDANRLASVNGVTYTYDANGNLKSDGVNRYSYDYANRMSELCSNWDEVGQVCLGDVYTYAYNGRGDRLQQTVGSVTTNYVLDLNAGLTQVLSDGTTTYLYGNGRVGEYNGIWTYYAADALGSVRQIVDASGTVQFAQSYEPYGDVLANVGSGGGNYGYAGEWTDASGLQYLRARYYNTGIGRFLTRDTWEGDYNNPLSLNRWVYVEGNPVRYSDPSGHTVFVCPCGFTKEGHCKECPLVPIFGTTMNPPMGGTGVPDLIFLLVFGCLFLASEAAEEIDIDWDQEDDWEFYYVELGDYPSEDLSSYHSIYQSLTSIIFIPGVDKLVNEIRNNYDQVYSQGKFWKKPLYFGRVFEGERALTYYYFGLLSEVNTHANVYDFEINDNGTLMWVEVKWSESGNTVNNSEPKNFSETS